MLEVWIFLLIHECLALFAILKKNLKRKKKAVAFIFVVKL